MSLNYLMDVSLYVSQSYGVFKRLFSERGDSVIPESRMLILKSPLDPGGACVAREVMIHDLLNQELIQSH